MRFDKLSFGSIHIDGITRDFEMVIDGGEIRKRKKQPSKNSPTNLDVLPSSSRRAYPDTPSLCDRNHSLTRPLLLI